MPVLETCEIVWHSDGFTPPEPVFSLSFYDKLLLTAGADRTARLWSVPPFTKNGQPVEEQVTAKVALLACLEGHKTPLACVRVSPCGDYLATSSSEPFIIIWEKAESTQEDRSSSTSFTFKKKRLLYGHEAEVFSVAFLPQRYARTAETETDAKQPLLLVSGSIDNKVILWDAVAGVLLQTFKHAAPVKDVAAPVAVFHAVHEEDCSSRNPLFARFEPPLKQVFASYGTDKALFFYSQKSNKQFLRKRIDNKDLAVFDLCSCSETENDSFVRRNAFSPDGRFFLQVGMRTLSSAANPPKHLAVLWDVITTKPVRALSGFTEPVILATFFPYRVRPKTCGDSWLGNTRYVFAVATTRSVLLYESTRTHPVFFVTNIHCTYITDLAWRNDGLAVSSSDGYVTFLKLGTTFFDKLAEQTELT